MRDGHAASRGERLRHLLLLATTLLAVLHLPRERFPLEWIVALALPAVLLRGLQGWRHGLTRLWVVVAAGVQAGMLQLAVAVAGPLEQAAALAGTLLPPLVFLTVRHRDRDVLSALLLSFSLLIAGSMLRGGGRLELVAAYVATGFLVLRLDHRAELRRHRNVVGRPPLRSRLLRTGTLLVTCGLAAILSLQALALLPAVTTEQTAAAAPGADMRGRRMGVPLTFDLDGAPGSPLQLTQDRLLRVRSLDGAALPEDLYLRCSFFDLPALDGWRTSRIPTRPRDTASRPWRLRPPVPGVPSFRVEVERLEALAGLVFVPAGTWQIHGMDGLLAAPERDWLHQPMARGPAVLTVHFQDVAACVGDSSADEGWDTLQELPSELRRRELHELLPLLLGEPPPSPAAIAARLTDGLQARCIYAPEEPRGPYPNAILNFLHGNRRGYCMHFASAMAILLRMAGVPCRVGIGLYGGEPDPASGDARYYGSGHAHAWVEIPFRELGWVVFDPTPPSQRALGARDPYEDPEGPAVTETAATLGDLLAPGHQPPLTWVLLCGGLLIAWLGLGWRPARRPTHAVSIPKAARPARRDLSRLLAALAAVAPPRAAGQTLTRYLEALRSHPELDHGRIADAFAAYEEVRFGARPYDTAREERLRRALAAVRRHASPAGP